METIKIYRFLSSYPQRQNNFIHITSVIINILGNISLKLFILCILIISLADYLFSKQQILTKSET